MEKTIKILIVEDSPTQAEKLCFLLEEEGYIVEKAENGKKALNALDIFTPDIIISDVLMPEMDGYEFCNKVKSNKKWKKTPVILLTSLSDPEDVIRGLISGADNFLTKPYKNDFLISRIKHVVINLNIRNERLSDLGIEIFFAGKKHFVNSDRLQIIDLLLSTYENAIMKNKELESVNNELNELKNQLEVQNKDLQELNEQKNQFLGMAAHDLRNPLGAISGFSQFLLEDSELNKQQKEFLKYIKDSSEFMLKLIDDLLDISSIESGTVTLGLKKTNLINFIYCNLDINKMLASKKNIEIDFTHPETIRETYIDRGKFDQLLNNLLSNAIKFSFPNTKIKVDLQQDEYYTLLSVKDEGQGIPEKELHLIFKPFSKTSVKSTAGEHSTGLGLAIVRKIVEGHKGDIWVESVEGKGSTFCVKIPITENLK